MLISRPRAEACHFVEPSLALNAVMLVIRRASIQCGLIGLEYIPACCARGVPYRFAVIVVERRDARLSNEARYPVNWSKSQYRLALSLRLPA